jgi:uncharacterized protein (DUF488 family)
MKVFTIGFTQKSAKHFFDLLRRANVKRVVDVRLNNTGQLAGFAKKDDLKFFLRELVEIDYIHVPELAPTQDILDTYKKHRGSWDVYEQEFLSLMEKRRIDQTVARDILDGGCLLCSEHKPHHCHRRLVLDYLQKKWGCLDRTDLI